jgi:hypothetical protein
MMPSTEKDLRESMKIILAEIAELRASKSSSPQTERRATTFTKKIVEVGMPLTQGAPICSMRAW